MQYDQRVLRPRSAPKPTLNQITLLSLVVLVFVFVFLVFFVSLRRSQSSGIQIYRQKVTGQQIGSSYLENASVTRVEIRTFFS